MKTINELLPALVQLRQYLHKIPEIAHKEYKTLEVIRYYMKNLQPDLLLENMGKTGLAVVFNGLKPGRTLMFRAELDALPIEEDIDIPYHSAVKTISHKCGHDGHMTMLYGLASLIAEKRPDKGRIVLLFQPAEETGTGAETVLADAQFMQIRPDYVFAIHNIPGFSKGSIILREGIFAMASEGMQIRLKGIASHVAYPEQGISPLPAMMDILSKLSRFNDKKKIFEDYTRLSITFARLGKYGFGITPGLAEIGLVLRAILPKDLEKGQGMIKRTVQKAAMESYLEEQYIQCEPFPATFNNPDVVKRIFTLALKNHQELIVPDMPFRWSEDFGHFTSRFPGALIGLGAGTNQSDLHTWYYDFPDDILEAGISTYYNILKEFIDD